jgi:hypothetical protein
MNEQRTPPNLQALPPVMTAKVQIKRAATGKTEDWTLTFTPLADQPQTDATQPEPTPCP